MNAAKSVDQEILQGLTRLNLKQKKTILSVVKSFMQEQKDWWDEISVEQQKAIDKALTETSEGKLTTHDEVIKKYK